MSVCMLVHPTTNRFIMINFNHPTDLQERVESEAAKYPGDPFRLYDYSGALKGTIVAPENK